MDVCGVAVSFRGSLIRRWLLMWGGLCAQILVELVGQCLLKLDDDDLDFL